MFEWLKRKSLTSALTATRRLRIKGVVFEIRKINVSHYAEGGKVLKQTMDTYRAGKDQSAAVDANWDKIQKHYADVLLAGVVSPRLKRKQDDAEGIWIDDLFVDWEMVQGVYEAISEMTYGKKKLTSPGLQGRS
jgi:hypothetical protein